MINTKILRPINWKNLIRIGKDNDGGYVIPYEIISKTDVLLSYGINKDWSFEKYFYEELFISKQNVMMFLAVLLLILFLIIERVFFFAMLFRQLTFVFLFSKNKQLLLGYMFS